MCYLEVESKGRSGVGVKLTSLKLKKLCCGLTPEQINLIAFLFSSQILRYNKYFKNTKVGCFRSKRFLGISNKAVYEGRKLLEGNCPKKIPKKIFFHEKNPTFTNTYIYIRLLRCKTN